VSGRTGWVRDNALSLGFGGLFVAALVGQAFSGLADVNEQRLTDGLPLLSLAGYVTSSTFAADVMENWQSEYLQFALYVFATVWLVQRGSPQSKEPGDEGTGTRAEQQMLEHADEESPAGARAGGWRTAVFSRSLGLVMGAVFLLTWAATAVAGWADFNGQQLAQHQDPVTLLGYLGHADFWNRTLQNWQSEFLAVGSMAIFSVYLRQRGSPESKPVGAPHEATAQSG
jgi:hypothetical protein